MSEMTSLAGLALALLLPWLLGAGIMAWLLRKTGQRCKWIVLGHGFFMGNLATIVLLRLFGEFGMLDNVLAIGAVMTVLALVAIVGARRKVPDSVPSSQTENVRATRWQWVLVALLVAWIGLRYGLMARELTLRPLYAWDAWMNWAPKAVTWYTLGDMVNYVHPSTWYAASANDYTLGNWLSSLYPPGVPLLLTWYMYGADSWNASIIYLPWLAAPLALGMAMYGHMRVAHVPLFAAVIVTYLILNMPYANSHSVLAGYADIWLAGAFTMALLALREWRITRHSAWAMVFIAMLALCTQLKNPGILLAMILAVFGLREWLRLPLRLELGAVVLAILLLVLVIGLGVRIPLPLVGTVSYSEGMLEAGYIGTYEIRLRPEVLGAVGASFFKSINWNLLFYSAPPLLLVLAWQNRKHVSLPSTEVLALLACAAFLVFTFFFTDRSKGALNFSTLNRAIFYLVPSLVFCLATSLLRSRLFPGHGQEP